MKTKTPSPKSNLKPLGDRVLIRQAKAEEHSGKILLPEEAKKRPHKGEIIAVGKEDGLVKVGDTVWYERYQAIPIEGQDDLFFVKTENLLAIELK